VRALRHTPGGAFGSARYKLAGIDKSRAQYERLIEVFKAHDIGYFFYNGGNDSMDTAHKVSEIGAQMGYPIACIGVPKTVDNDLAITDCCPDLARRRSTSRCRPARQRSTCCRWRAPRPRCSCSKSWAAMRDGSRPPAAWRASAGGCSAHHFVPEIAFERKQFLDKVKSCVERFGYCVVVVSEGVRTADGKFLAEAGTKDAFGHAQLGGVGPVVAQMTQEALATIPLGRRRLPATLRAAHRLQGGRGAGLCRGQGRGGTRSAGKKRRNAHHREKVVRALSVGNRSGSARDDRQPEKKLPRSFITEDGFGIMRPAALS